VSAPDTVAEGQTALIAPVDYDHIYTATGKTKGSKTNATNNADTVAPGQTYLIAPADYNHIYKGRDNKENQKK